MVFKIITKKNRSSMASETSGKYVKLMNEDQRYSFGSEIRMPVSTTYDKRLSEHSFNSVSNESVAETFTSTVTSNTLDTSDVNDSYVYNQPEYTNDYDVNGNFNKKQKKHKKRKTISKIFKSFSLDGQLHQTLECPDWEYYCHKQNYYGY
ncbi:hypothetical protein H8356DRAFT_1053531 [Neocallimastix lanati (nom. inval.)]|jgi:hypothetical protein|uniref:Uncharacterized protein n=1 Tax=Neocallimastix californiae TaxID=1754190 RepID=A0A1Y2EGG9_9FUNG|nr:hypothetical protein H8356DRAFT_1053531 [Neocallimastix sp. JGI-2020a]ORY70670.1 hypothetical protein LY90DRAFT_667317 [Neocallimastix californiae]|eukprot:ORY70670.1 hypothetical protein LY90DRAFT_667317 [Neocallimastix californiae]